jgi:competence protein ComEA
MGKKGGKMKRKKQMSLYSMITAALILVCTLPLIAAEMDKVNINSADKQLLMTLDGIGESYADRIIEYRKKNGPFQSPADILKVKGIGEKTYELNKHRMTVKDE